ncbi:MAG: hypothetical protein ACYCU0_06400 [Solirubrobacteraceae bacterium]
MIRRKIMSRAVQDGDAASAVPNDQTRVRLRLEFGGCSREELEDWAIVIQEVVDAADPDLHAAIGCILDPMTVEILFAVENETTSQVHERVARVVGSIEAVVPARFDTDAATRSTDSQELVAA